MEILFFFHSYSGVFNRIHTLSPIVCVVCYTVVAVLALFLLSICVCDTKKETDIIRVSSSSSFTRLFICILQDLLRPYNYQIDNPCLGHNNHLYGLYIIRRIENRRTVLDISCVSKVRQHLSLIINNNNI